MGLTATDRCLLCPRRPSYRSIFVPHKPEVYGGRVLTLALCRRCVKKGKRWWTARVEAILARRAAATKN